jgi:uncharacterized membrane protein YccC
MGALSMMATDAEAVLFSAKCFAAAMIAYYVSLSIGFSEPAWAVTTVYLVSQPLAGAALSRSLYRLLGTVLGGAAAVIFLPAFVNEPLALSFVLALWLGLCVYMAQLDRTPRSYTFLLAGYTASIIGFPSVLEPAGIFNTAILRVQEISIAIAAAGLVHGAVWPRTIARRLQDRITSVLNDSERWSRGALFGRPDPTLDLDRHRLARDVDDIEQLAAHLAFDTARWAPPGQVIRAFRDQISWLLPLSGAFEDQIAECARQSIEFPREVAALITRVDRWLGEELSASRRDEVAHELVADAAKLEATIAVENRYGWRELLLVSVLSILGEIVIVHRVLRELHSHIMQGTVSGLSPEAVGLVTATAGRALHRDHVLALRSAFGTMVAVCGVCAFWIFTAWPTGTVAAMIAGIACALFGSQPRPDVAIGNFFLGSLSGIVVAAGYGFVVLPRVTDFVMLASVLAPILLLLGSMLARPTLAPLAVAGLVGFLNTVGLAATYQSDFAGFVNGAIAQVAGIVASIVIIGIFHVIGPDVAFARLRRAGFRDIAARADGKARDTQRWVNRMLDRTALIAARAGSFAAELTPPPYDTLVGLRIGYLAGELHVLLSTLTISEERAALGEVLRGVSEHFHRIESAGRKPAERSVLEAIDRAITAFVADSHVARRRSGLILLTGLRRSLFPQANVYEGAAG